MHAISYKNWYFIFQEEIMTLERILLQTIKFDLQVDHPYACLLKFAKQVKSKLFYTLIPTNCLSFSFETKGNKRAMADMKTDTCNYF